MLAAIVEAEGIEPIEDELVAALEPLAENRGTTARELYEELEKNGRLDRLREDVATRQAVELLVGEANTITVEQAKAREEALDPWPGGVRRGRRAALDPGFLTLGISVATQRDGGEPAASRRP